MRPWLLYILVYDTQYVEFLLQPLLDVLLFTRSLSRVMGYKGQIGLYGYYVAVAWLLRALAPPLAQMTAQESALVGSFRCAMLGTDVTHREGMSHISKACGTPISIVSRSRVAAAFGSFLVDG